MMMMIKEPWLGRNLQALIVVVIGAVCLSTRHHLNLLEEFETNWVKIQ